MGREGMEREKGQREGMGRKGVGERKEEQDGAGSGLARGGQQGSGPKLQTSDVFFQAENAPKLFSAGVTPRTPLGKLTTLPIPP